MLRKRVMGHLARKRRTRRGGARQPSMLRSREGLQRRLQRGQALRWFASNTRLGARLRWLGGHTPHQSIAGHGGAVGAEGGLHGEKGGALFRIRH